jgi:16S rRNA processing protein RimM
VARKQREWLAAGRVGRPHGLDGSFHVTRPRGGLLLLGGTVRVDGSDLEIVRRAGTDERPILRLAGRDGRAAAEALRGEELLVARDRAPALDADEWYAEDL